MNMSNNSLSSTSSNNKITNLIYVKYELFDHLIYPLSIKLDDNAIIQLFRKLHIMSTIDYKISYKEWLEQSMANLSGFTEKEAKILFSTYKIYASEFEQTKSGNNNSRYESQKANDNVDVRYFGLFFALQLFLQRSKNNFNIDTRDKNPYNISNNMNMNIINPLSSPRGKGSSSARAYTGSTLEYQMIINFIKSNLKLFLRLIASDIHNTETSLNSNEFNTLKFFFKFGNELGKDRENTNNNLSSTLESNSSKNVSKFTKSKTDLSINTKSTSSNSNTSQLSSLAPFFVNFSTTTKINIDIITEWLNNTIYSLNSSQYAAMVDFEDLVYLKNLSKCVTIKESTSNTQSNIQNKNVKITQCEDSYIYINTNIQTVRIANCNNCTIVIAAVSKITSIDKCENCHICVATNLLRVSNTIDSVVYSYSMNQPILYGDNRALVMAPHNVYYTELILHMKNAKFPSVNSAYINNFANPVTMHWVEDQDNEKLNYQVMNFKDFSAMITPFNTITSTTGANTITLPLAPKDYVNVVQERENRNHLIKQMISEANLQEEQEKALHVAIQGYFREWLVSSGNIKPMTEIVKMIDQPSSTVRNTNNNEII